MSTVVSAKVPEELKRKADKYGIKVSKLVRDALEEKVRAIESQALSLHLDEIQSKIGSKVKRQDIIKAARESRDER